MLKQKPCNYEVMKSMFKEIPPTWDARISLESKNLWDSSGVIIAGDNYRAVRNEIFTQLVNRIAMTKVHSKVFSNPLSIYRKGVLPFGDAIQEMSTDVIQPEQFEGTKNVDQFKVYKNEVLASYHVSNRRQLYRITIPDPTLKKAFISEHGLAELLASIMSMMGGSNEIDEFIYCKEVFKAYYENTESPIQKSQIIDLPNILSPNKSTKDILNFVETIKKVMHKMRFPNRKFSSSGVMCQSSPDNMSIILDTDISVINEVNVLSQAFNPQYLGLSTPIIGVDNLIPEKGIIGCLLDNESMGIYDVLRQTTQADNAMALYRNFFYHIHQTYYMSPFTQTIFLRIPDLIKRQNLCAEYDVKNDVDELLEDKIDLKEDLNETQETTEIPTQTTEEVSE